MSALHFPRVTAMILAGGRARRMGGEDKGLLGFLGRPLIERILEAVAPQVGDVFINANRNRDRYRNYGYTVIADERSDFQGPLAGFASGLTHCATEDLAILPCDGPLVPEDLVFRLWQARAEAGAELAVAHDGERMQPVYVLLRKTLLPDLRAFLETGERKIDRWYARHRTAQADFSDCKDCFANINYPRDRDRLEKQWRENAP